MVINPCKCTILGHLGAFVEILHDTDSLSEAIVQIRKNPLFEGFCEFHESATEINRKTLFMVPAWVSATIEAPITGP